MKPDETPPEFRPREGVPEPRGGGGHRLAGLHSLGL